MSAPAVGTSGTFIVDPGVSRFTVRAFAGGMLSALGHSPTFSARDYHGEVTFDPNSPATASLTVTVKAASLALVDDMSQSDRRTIEKTMHEQVLESAKYPEIRYVSDKASVTPSASGPFEATLRGTLSLHGSDELVEIAAKVVLTGDMLRAFGDFTLRQSDFGIKQVNVAGGTLKVKDELTCAFDMVARRKPAPASGANP